MFLRLAEEEGIDIGNFDLTVMQPKDMTAAMAAGHIDAFMAWEPFCADAVVNNVGVIYKNSSDIWPGHICCVVAVDKTFAANHPDIVINFLKAHIDATNWINAAKASGPGSANYDFLTDIAASFTGRPHAVIERALSNINYKFDMDESFKGCFIEFTYKLIQYNIVASGTFQDQGYRDALDFANKYVNTSYLTKAEQT
jgi:ABC-type taurine transport system substrate-binding protein